jgi:hypothetical protein
MTGITGRSIIVRAAATTTVGMTIAIRGMTGMTGMTGMIRAGTIAMIDAKSGMTVAMIVGTTAGTGAMIVAM